MAPELIIRGTTELQRMGPGGRGVLKHHDRDIFVAGAAPGDTVSVLVEHLSPHRLEAWGRVTAVHARSPSFVEPPCPRAWPVRGACGGCPLQHLSLTGRTFAKHSRVLDALGLDIPFTIHPLAHITRYRNRANFVAATGSDDLLILGSYAPRSRDVASMSGCLVHRAPIDAVADLLRALPLPAHPAPDALRYVTIRAGTDGDVCVELVLNTHDAPPWLRDATDALMAHDAVVGVLRSANTSPGNTIHRGSETLLAGRAYVTERVGPLSFDVPPRAFVQLYSCVAQTMYQRAAELLVDPVTLWDLYCGVGGLGLTAALRHRGARLLGVELHEDAVRIARDAARRAGVDATFLARDLSSVLSSRHLDDSLRDPDALLVNPPRRGLDAPTLELLARVGRQLVYMSCDARSFARDTATLASHGWRPCAPVEVFDMLPMTEHVELLAHFTRDPPQAAEGA
ncbi:MAG: hypothetical protein AAGI01_02200 [Myxococcota bacterium]